MAETIGVNPVWRPVTGGEAIRREAAAGLKRPYISYLEQGIIASQFPVSAVQQALFTLGVATTLITSGVIAASSTQRINPEWRLTRTCQMPIGHQVILVHLNPRLHQFHLPAG